MAVELGEALLCLGLVAMARNEAEHFRAQVPELLHRAGQAHAFERAGRGKAIEVADDVAKGLAGGFEIGCMPMPRPAGWHSGTARHGRPMRSGEVEEQALDQ